MSVMDKNKYIEWDISAPGEDKTAHAYISLRYQSTFYEPTPNYSESLLICDIDEDGSKYILAVSNGYKLTNTMLTLGKHLELCRKGLFSDYLLNLVCSLKMHNHCKRDVCHLWLSPFTHPPAFMLKGARTEYII